MPPSSFALCWPLIFLIACQPAPEPSISAIPQGYDDVLFRDIRHASWSPDGTMLLVTVDYGGNQELDLFATDGIFLRPLVRSAGYEGVAHWSASRDEILFQTNQGAEDSPAFSLYAVQPDGNNLQRIVPVDFPTMFGRWSPDGTKLVFNDVAQPTPRQVHVFDTATQTVTKLTASDDFDSDYGSWSPDNEWLLFESNRDGVWDTYRMRPDGSEVTRIGLKTSSAPRYSPDGTLIAFHEVRNGTDYDVFLAEADGSNQRILAGGPGDQRLPEWAPDGTRLAYISNAAGHHDLFTIRVDGTDTKQLTQQPENEFFTVLHRDGLVAAQTHVDALLATNPEQNIFRDDRALVQAIHRARQTNNAEHADALITLGLRIFPESPALQALQSDQTTP